MKVLIVFDTKYGNTQRVAELIADGFNSVDGNETEVVNVKNFEFNKDKAYNLILIGSPNHGGYHTKKIKEFISNFSKSSIEVNSIAGFDTHTGKYFNAVKKMEKQINKIFPNSTNTLPGLSVKLNGIKGPIVEDNLPECKEYGIKLAKKE